jgi:hypothetical protein
VPKNVVVSVVAAIMVTIVVLSTCLRLWIKGQNKVSTEYALLESPMLRRMANII